VWFRKENKVTQGVEVHKVMNLEELGLERRAGADRAVFAFAHYAEARIAKWVQFPKGILLFLMVPGDPESGWFYLLDRARGTFYSLDVAEDGRWGGYREEEFEQLSYALALKRLAARPQKLRSAGAVFLTEN
jgi:hypothetical protein